MDNKLIDIKNSIKSKENCFRIYLESNLDNEILEFIDILGKHTSLYLFSGIIRDFFVAPKSVIRDVDLVYDTENDINIEYLLLNYKFKKNSFGGYKIFIKNYIVDIWNLNETWGLNKGQLTFKFNSLHKLPDTTFFNFSSIVYSLNENEFIVGRPFLDFIKKKEIDLVMEENPFPELCVINTMYYQKKMNFKLSKKLREYIINKEEIIPITELLDIQIKHFNEILFDEDEIHYFFDEQKLNRKQPFFN